VFVKACQGQTLAYYENSINADNKFLFIKAFAFAVK